MSLLSNFANTAYATASAVIGTESLAIDGGSSISAVQNQVRHARDFEDGGFAPDSALELVCARSAFSAAYASAGSAYVGKLATFDGATYRITDVEVGKHAVTLRVAHKEDAT